jgi:hypothetical protein
MAAAAAFDCKRIIDKIEERFVITGLESLDDDTFYISVAKKENPDEELAYCSGYIWDDERKQIYLDIIHRLRFGENNSTKGIGLLLLDLVACHAIKKGLSLSFDAVPSCGGANIENNNMRLYNYYNRHGMKAAGAETINNNGTRRRIYLTSPNNLRTALQSRYSRGNLGAKQHLPGACYKGGKRRRTRRTRK